MLLVHVLLQITVALAYSYAPKTYSCDSSVSLVRQANGLSEDESNWLDKRLPQVRESMKDYLKYSAKLNESEYSFLYNDSVATPKIGIALSGGGARAMLVGAGQIAALDNRTTGSFEHGLGGVLESTTYLAGLSGGGWLVGSLAFENFASVESIVNKGDSKNNIWDFRKGVFDNSNIAVALVDMAKWLAQIEPKNAAGYEISLGDIWGRFISEYLFAKSDNDHGFNKIWSSLRDTTSFQNAEYPFPILVTDVWPYWKDTDSLSYDESTLIEINPYELGSWDPSLDSFTDVATLGTKLKNGYPVSGKCVKNYDNAGFILSTTSNLLSTEIDSLSDELEVIVSKLVDVFLAEYPLGNDSFYSIVKPNPFVGTSYGNLDVLKNNVELTLVDGGDDDEVVPFVPLLQAEREVDLIFAFDDEADTTDKWPNGTSLYNTYQRQFSDIGANIAFPVVPDADTFVSEGLNHKPVFFGCNATASPKADHIPPIVVYVANAYYSYYSNTSTTDFTFSLSEKLSMIQNGFEQATRNNLTDDSNFQGCIGCAMIKRTQERLGQEPSEFCQQCFSDYCY